MASLIRPEALLHAETGISNGTGHARNSDSLHCSPSDSMGWDREGLAGSPELGDAAPRRRRRPVCGGAPLEGSPLDANGVGAWEACATVCAAAVCVAEAVDGGRAGDVDALD